MSSPQERREQAPDEVELILQRVVLDESALKQVRAIVREEIAAAFGLLAGEAKIQIDGETIGRFAVKAVARALEEGRP